MNVILSHFVLHQKLTWRRPAAVILNLLLPLMIFYSVVPGKQHSVAVQEHMTVSFMAFSVLGVMFYQFGSLVAEDRHTQWSRYVSLLAVSDFEIVLARTLSGVFIALLAPFVLYVFALQTTGITLTSGEISKIVALLTLGAVPFAMMGLTIALYFEKSIAVSLAQFVYYPLVYMGGLWSSWEALPSSIQSISYYLPTRHLGELGWGLLRTQNVAMDSVAILATYGAVFGVLALRGIRRQADRET